MAEASGSMEIMPQAVSGVLQADIGVCPQLGSLESNPQKTSARSKRAPGRSGGIKGLSLLAPVLGLFAAACSEEPESELPTEATVEQFVPASEVAEGARLASAVVPFEEPSPPGEWHWAGKNYSASRYSELNQINTDNVHQLEVAWTLSTGQLRGHEAAPIVANGMMYITTPHPNIVYAIDLNSPGTVKWSFNPRPPTAAMGVACCDVVNRGAAYSDGKVVFNTLANSTIALDANTGEKLWETKLGDINKGETMTMAPLIADGKVLVGNSGADLGVRGWLTALDLDTGEVEWRGLSTGPDEDVLIDQEYFRPFYEKDRGVDLGVVTWPPGFWRIGGGSVWGWLAYDPELRLVYYGSANPGSWNALIRPGDNKWSNTIFARDIDTGRVKWAYQIVAHDEWDHDGVNEMILADLVIDGQMRKVLIKPDRTGYMLVMDRATGEVISAESYAYINTYLGLDKETGKMIKNPEVVPKWDTWVRNVCPAAPGAKDWQPSAFSPKNGLMYVPHQNLCMDWKVIEANYISGTPFTNIEAMFYAGPGGHQGEYTAWDPVNQRPVWTIKEKWPVWSGTAVTAGDLAIYGTMDGYFKVVHALTGELLYQFKTGSGIISQPTVYLGPDGRQYIAVLSGVGGWAGVPVILGTDTPTAAVGFGAATSKLKDETNQGGMLYVFALPDDS
jgi:alcohol dehydrogenase (cytochrome c)